MNGQINIIVDIEVIHQAFAEDSPFNLKKDIKNLNLNQYKLDLIAIDIADEVRQGFERPSCTAIFWSKKRECNYAKVKVAKDNNCGKSDGYRCIIIWDDFLRTGYLLHIYDHNIKDNISNREKNKLKAIVNQYVNYNYKE